MSFNIDSPTVAGMQLTEALVERRSGYPQELIANGYDINYWTSQYTYNYLKTIQLAKYRGFTPFLQTINDGDVIDMHHFRMFTFRKMSCHVSDIIATPSSAHKGSFENLIKEYGPRKAEALAIGLYGILDYLNTLKGTDGKFRHISESDIEFALKKNFGADWKEVQQIILEENTGTLEDFIKEWNKRTDSINSLGLAGFLAYEFEKEMTSSKKYIQDIWLGSTIHPRKAGGIQFDIQMALALGTMSDYLYFLILAKPTITSLAILENIQSGQQTLF